MARRVGINQFYTAISKELSKYADQIDDGVGEVIQEVSEDTVRELKATSPKSSRKGRHYPSFWDYQQENVNWRKKATIFVNAPKYRLPHLLEFPHEIKNGSGSYGTSKPQEHIKPAAEKMAKEFEEKIKKLIRG